MRFKELLKKDLTELVALCDETQAKYEQLACCLVTGGVKNVRDLRSLRKDIARLKTRIAALSQAPRV